MSALELAYEKKPMDYFQSSRPDIVLDLPKTSNLAVLDVGCGSGGFLNAARASGKVGYAAGVEINPDAAKMARDHLDQVVVGNIEVIDLPFCSERFDVLVLSEVLEHLVDPWEVLKRLRSYVKRDGLLYASSPNVAHISVLRQLLRGRFDYRDRGIMDWTHLRWFTAATYREMIERSGFHVLWSRPLVPPTPKQRIANAVTFGRLAHIFAAQTFVKARRL